MGKPWGADWCGHSPLGGCALAGCGWVLYECGSKGLGWGCPFEGVRVVGCMCEVVGVGYTVDVCV